MESDKTELVVSPTQKVDGLTVFSDSGAAKMMQTTQPSEEDVADGQKALIHWTNASSAEKQGLAVSLVKGNSLINLKSNDVLKYLGKPSQQTPFAYELEKFASFDVRLVLEFKKDAVVESYIEMKHAKDKR